MSYLKVLEAKINAANQNLQVIEAKLKSIQQEMKPLAEASNFNITSQFTALVTPLVDAKLERHAIMQELVGLHKIIAEVDPSRAAESKAATKKLLYQLEHEGDDIAQFIRDYLL